MFIKFEPTSYFIGKRKCSKSLCRGMHGYSKLACESQTHFRSSLLSLRKIPIFRREKRRPEMRLLFAGYSKQAVLNFFKQVLKLAKILNYIAIKGGGRPTRLLPHVKMLLIPIQSFLPVSIAPYKL